MLRTLVSDSIMNLSTKYSNITEVCFVFVLLKTSILIKIFKTTCQIVWIWPTFNGRNYDDCPGELQEPVKDPNHVNLSQRQPCAPSNCPWAWHWTPTVPECSSLYMAAPDKNVNAFAGLEYQTLWAEMNKDWGVKWSHGTTYCLLDQMKDVFLVDFICSLPHPP